MHRNQLAVGDDTRLHGLSPEVLTAGGEPRLFYRGTQRRDLPGFRGATSWTDSIAVALIWSAMPGDSWASSPERSRARLVDTSTIHAAHLALRSPLVFAHNSGSVGDIMRLLRYGEADGLVYDELRKVWNYLHNRLYGRAKGGEFNYVVYDEDGDQLDPYDAPFSLTGSVSWISELRDEQEYADTTEQFVVADRIECDAYVFFDSKTVQAVARRLGFDGFVYPDLFQGCAAAAPELFGESVNCDALAGVTIQPDVNGELVATHRTYRPLDESSVVHLWDAPSALIVPEVSA